MQRLQTWPPRALLSRARLERAGQDGRKAEPLQLDMAPSRLAAWTPARCPPLVPRAPEAARAVPAAALTSSPTCDLAHSSPTRCCRDMSSSRRASRTSGGTCSDVKESIS